MINHIIPSGVYYDHVINYIQKNVAGQHCIYIINNKSEKILSCNDNLCDIAFNCDAKFKYLKLLFSIIKFYLLLLKSRSIIFHSLFLPSYLFIVMLFVPNFKKKQWNWIIFGGDLYDRKNYTQSSSYLRKLFFKLKLSQAKRFGYITTLTKGDYALAKDFYNVSGKNYVIIYGDPQKLKTTISTITESGKDKANDKKNDQQRTIKILIGNSATKENQHEEVLYILSKYANENIEIFVPLSYGDMSYKINIQDLGHKIFGEKFHAITDFMAYKDYVSFLNSIDIGIFNNNRQQALGNLYLLNGLGKKVFIRKDTSMWEHFHNKLGLKIFPVESIINLSFDDFIFIDEIDIINNRSNMDTFLTDDENGSDVWNQLIFDMESRS